MSDEQTKTEAVEPKTEPVKSTSQKKTKAKRYSVRFKGNRKYELYVGRKVWVFGPHETKELPEDVVNHEDFKQVAYLFTVREA